MYRAETASTKNGGEVNAVNARELHKKLECTERFSVWFERQLTYGFAESIDFCGCKVFNAQANKELDDYFISLDMAKEISMIQRSAQGKAARRYFIECEKQAKSNHVAVRNGDMGIPISELIQFHTMEVGAVM